MAHVAADDDKCIVLGVLLLILLHLHTEFSLFYFDQNVSCLNLEHVELDVKYHHSIVQKRRGQVLHIDNSSAVRKTTYFLSKLYHQQWTDRVFLYRRVDLRQLFTRLTQLYQGRL